MLGKGEDKALSNFLIEPVGIYFQEKGGYGHRKGQERRTTKGGESIERGRSRRKNIA